MFELFLFVAIGFVSGVLVGMFVSGLSINAKDPDEIEWKDEWDKR